MQHKHLETITAWRAVDNAFLQESLTGATFVTFRRQLLKHADAAVEAGESEEFLKSLIRPFFTQTNFGLK